MNYKKGLKIWKKEGSIVLIKRTLKHVLNKVEKSTWEALPSKYQCTIFKLRTRKNKLKSEINHEAVRDPYDKIQIQPSRIKYRNKEATSPHFGLGLVVGGNWDSKENRQKCEDFYKYVGLKERFEKGKNWENTKYYSPKRANDRYEFNDLLFESMKKEGYKTTSERKSNRTDYYRDKLSLEILVTIDRNGKFNLYDGWHRFTIASILEIPIYVQVLARHKKWQKIRDDIYNNGISDEYDEKLNNHPDLQDVLE